MIHICDAFLPAQSRQIQQLLIGIAGIEDHKMIEHQIIAGAIGHQHIAVGIQNIATGGPDSGAGHIGDHITGRRRGIRDLHRIQLDAEKTQHQHHQGQQKHGSYFGYSFHASPPILPMERTSGYRNGTAISVSAAVMAILWIRWK